VQKCWSIWSTARPERVASVRLTEDPNGAVVPPAGLWLLLRPVRPVRPVRPAP